MRGVSRQGVYDASVKEASQAFPDGFQPACRSGAAFGAGRVWLTTRTVAPRPAPWRYACSASVTCTGARQRASSGRPGCLMCCFSSGTYTPAGRRGCAGLQPGPPRPQAFWEPRCSYCTHSKSHTRP